MILLVDFSKLYISIHLRILAYDIPKEIPTSLMMLYKNTKAMVRSPDGDTDFFEFVARVLQEDFIIATYVNILPWLHTGLCHRSYKRKIFHIKKEEVNDIQKNLWDPNYLYNLEFLSNTTASAKYLQHSLKEVAGSTCLKINVNKWSLSVLNKKELSPH